MNVVGVVIFVVTYVLVSARRLTWLGIDRPAAALLGAVAYVAFGILSADDAIAAIDGATLLLLFGVMGMGAFLVVDGFFDALEARLLRPANTPGRLLAAVVWGAGVLSAFITNDAVCLLGAPLLVRLIERANLPPLPYLLALATAANTGSAATLVGNPQNMLCGQLGGLAYLDYALSAVPLTVVALGVNHAILAFAYRGRLTQPATPAQPPPPQQKQPPSLLTPVVILATAVLYALGAPLAWTAAGGFVALALLKRYDTASLWRHIDGSLLLFFAGLFVVVAGLRESGATAWLFAHFPLATATDLRGTLQHAAIFLVGSNVVSNVPFILVVQEQLDQMADPQRAWTLLAVISTFAGNLTLLGSAANIIVAEAARDIGGLGFWQHLRIGAPVALLTSLLGALWLAL